MRQQAPSAAAAQDIEDGVEDLARIVDARPSCGFRIGGQVGFEAGPFRIGKVGLVRLSRHARNLAGSLPEDPFSDGF